MPYEARNIVSSEEEACAILPAQHEAQVEKVINFFDDLCQIWIERSPFVVMSTDTKEY